MCGRRKSRVFCPSWNLIQKFWILEDKKQTEGEGRQTDSRRTDGRTFPVSANSPKNLQAATQVSPFVTFWLRAAAAQWSQIKSPWCVKSEPLHEPLNGHGILGFRAFLLWFYCAHRFNAHAGLVCFIYQQTSADFTGALRESCCAGFYPAKAETRTSHSLRVSRPTLVFPPSSRKQSGHNCALYMVKSSFVWRKRLAARLPCKVLRPRWRCAKADKSRGNRSKLKLQRLRKFSDPITKMGVRLRY